MPLKVKCIGISIGICNIGPTFTWYRIDTRICGMEQPMVVFSAHAAICGRAGKMFTNTLTNTLKVQNFKVKL